MSPVARWHVSHLLLSVNSFEVLSRHYFEYWHGLLSVKFVLVSVLSFSVEQCHVRWASVKPNGLTRAIFVAVHVRVDPAFFVMRCDCFFVN